MILIRFSLLILVILLLLVLFAFLALGLGQADSNEQTGAVDKLQTELRDLSGWRNLERLLLRCLDECGYVHASLHRVKHKEAELERDEECKDIDNWRHSLLDLVNELLVVNGWF